jgi:hypothetical protein
MVYYSYTGNPSITTSGNYTVLTFDSDGSFTTNANLDISYIIVGGGGGGRDTLNYFDIQGGGGGGEVLTGKFNSNLGSNYNINIGLGGLNNQNGENTLLQGTNNSLTLTARGGYTPLQSIVANHYGGNNGNGSGGGIYGILAINGGGGIGINEDVGLNGASLSIIDYTGSVNTNFGGGGGGGGGYFESMRGIYSYYNGGNGGGNNAGIAVATNTNVGGGGGGGGYGGTSNTLSNGGNGGNGYGGGGGGGGYNGGLGGYGGSGTVILYFIDSPIPSCFNHDTKILCFDETLNQELYIPIQDMKVGTFVKTYKHGYKKVELIGKGATINNPEDKYKSMYKMKKQGDMLDDLILTGNHSILVDRFKIVEADKQKKEFKNEEFYMIDDKYILFAKNALNFEQIIDNKFYTYYHFVLENDAENKYDDTIRYGVWANGVLAESSDKKHFIKHGYEIIKL